MNPCCDEGGTGSVEVVPLEWEDDPNDSGFIGCQASDDLRPFLGSSRLAVGLMTNAASDRGLKPGPPNAGPLLWSPGLGRFGSANRTTNG